VIVEWIRRLETVAVVVAAVVVVVVGGLRLYDRFVAPAPVANDRVALPAVQPADGMTIDLTETSLRISGAPRLGIVEFSDFQCPYCGIHARDIYPQLQRDFVSTGIAGYAFLSMPLESIHPLALQASEAAECGRSEGRFWDLHDRFFADQRALTSRELSAHAAAVGITLADFEKCMLGETLPRIRAQTRVGEALDVRSTPTFYLGTLHDGRLEARVRLNGVIQIETWTREIERLISDATR
jgi:protein-disulfide isomerase